MEATVYTPAQQYLLRIFSHIKSEEELNDIRDLICKYYDDKLQQELDRLWDAGILDQKRLDEINEMDLHQWLREQKARENVTE